MPEHDDPRVSDTVPDDISQSEDAPISTHFEPGTDRRVKRAVIRVVIVLAVAFLLVHVVRFFHARALSSETRAASTAAPPVDVVIARPIAGGQELVLPGQTAAWYESTIYARVNGYVKQWYVDIGDHVTRGQLLATIETPDLDAELAAARAQLKTSEALVTARKAEQAFAKTTNERWSGAPKGVVSEQERESKKADLDTASARLFAAEAQVAQDRSRVAQYSAFTAYKEVRAPFDGTITQRHIDIGNLVTAGSTSTTTSLYQITQNDPLRIFVDAPQSAAGELMQPGVPAQIRAAGSVQGVINGKIVRSAEAINTEARTLRVEVDVPNPHNALVPGMYVSVAFGLPARGSVEVPAAALLFRSSGPQVARVDRSGRVELVDVSIARDNGNEVELGSGVEPGDELILNMSSQIVAGQVVAPRRAPGSAAPASAASADRLSKR